MSDTTACSQIDIPYCPDSWKDEILVSWDQFLENAIHSSSALATSKDSLTPELLFPPRQLTNSEHSITMRHLIAIKLIGNGIKPAIIIEDDAIISDNSLINRL